MYTLSEIDVYVMSCNRMNYLEEMIRSISKQFPVHKISISENSSILEQKRMIIERYNTLNVIDRGSLSAIDHFTTILNETKKKFCLILHDDDYLLDGFFDEVLLLVNTEDAIAYGFNAINIPSNKRFLCDKSNTNKIVIKDQDFLIHRYTSVFSRGVAPFPSYIYKMEKVRQERPLFQNGGKYFDASFLISLLKNGNITWSTKCVLSYRSHASNDNNIRNNNDKVLLRNFYKRTVSNRTILFDFRMDILYTKLLDRYKNKFNIIKNINFQLFIYFVYAFIRRLLAKSLKILHLI